MYRVPRLRTLSLLAVVIVAAVLLGACTGHQLPASHNAAARFKTAVANPNRHYTVYWLGTEFEAAGLRYRGPFAPGLGDVTDPSSLLLAYSVDAPARGGGIEIQLSSSQKLKIPADYGIPHAVRVGSFDATLYTGKLNGGGENQSIVIPLGDTVVIASTVHTVGTTPDSELNPLTNADTFLAVMQHLRPYPQ